ncbi:MAG: hypothetical protein K6B46_02125 [Opitutales bacterium]|nr:hypothetical protein [Opitutales bacterium]
MHLHYWVRVRESGNYESGYDSGIRERIVIIRSKREIEELLSELCPVSKEIVPASASVNFALLADKGARWHGEILSNTKILIEPNVLFTLKNYRFPVFCNAICAVSETWIRSEAIGKPTYVNPSWVTFNKEDARNLEMLEYNETADGLSHDFVRVYYR